VAATDQAQGETDPGAGQSFYNKDTKKAILNCKEKSKYLQDLFPLDQLYIKKGCQAARNLPTWISLGGESKLKCFYNNLAHFLTSGM
jgi:hypothetical protein